MPANRMNREQFYAKVSGLDAGQLRKVLWTLYWRGTAQARERIEDALNLSGEPKRKPEPAGPGAGARRGDRVRIAGPRWRVDDGDRRVSRTERSKWRLTFRTLATQP